MPKKDGTWKMPAWMEPFRESILDTGGNPVEELVNDRSTSVFSNAIRAVLCVSVKDQVALLYILAQRGLLVGVPKDVSPAQDGWGA